MDENLILIKELGLKFPTSKSPQRVRYGLYKCTHCDKEVVKDKPNVKKAKSCGCLQNKKTLIYGIGINDANYPVSKRVDGKRIECKYYAKWRRMMQRSYDTAFHEKNPTYKDVTVCKEWHSFMNFRAWMVKQNWENKELDKDILYPDNKVYSPVTCLFVSRMINNLVHTGKGVTWHKGNKSFMVAVRSKKKGQEFLGYFHDEDEAKKVYLKRKVEILNNAIMTECDLVARGLRRHIAVLEKKLHRE